MWQQTAGGRKTGGRNRVKKKRGKELRGRDRGMEGRREGEGRECIQEGRQIILLKNFSGVLN